MSTVICLECGANIDLPEDAIVGELLVCAECDTEFEVTSLNPVAIEEAPEVEEDWGE